MSTRLQTRPTRLAANASGSDQADPPAQSPQDTVDFTAGLVQIIIWTAPTEGLKGVNPVFSFGHVSFVIGDQSYSWQAHIDSTTGQEVCFPASKYISEKQKDGSKGTQTNSYDLYGNRSVVGSGITVNSNNRMNGYSYDSAGNLLNDGSHAYTYDAENKIAKVDAVAAYVYDGEGQRVRKLLGENLRFVYGRTIYSKRTRCGVGARLFLGAVLLLIGRSIY